MYLIKDCAATFLKCVAAGSGQMIGMAIGMTGTKVAGQAIGNLVDKTKEANDQLNENKPYRRMVTYTVKHK